MIDVSELRNIGSFYNSAHVLNAADEIEKLRGGLTPFAHYYTTTLCRLPDRVPFGLTLAQFRCADKLLAASVDQSADDEPESRRDKKANARLLKAAPAMLDVVLAMLAASDLGIAAMGAEPPDFTAAPRGIEACQDAITKLRIIVAQVRGST
jgi:hypothetical protein